MPRKRSSSEKKTHAARERERRASAARAAGRAPGVTQAPRSIAEPATPRIARIEPRPELGELPPEHWPELRRVVEYRLFSLQKYRRSLTVNINRSSLRLALSELPERPAPDDVWRWTVALADPKPKGAGLKPSTVNRYKAHLSAAYEWCRKRGLYTANPCAGLPDLEEPSDVKDDAPGALGGPLAAVELYERLRLVLSGDELVFLALLRFCGLTREELFGLDETDFDLRSGTMTIRRGQRAGLDTSAKELKTANRRRVFVLGDFIPARELRELVALVRTPRLKARAYGEREPGGHASFEPTTRIFPWSSHQSYGFTLKLRSVAPDVFGAPRSGDQLHRPLHIWRHAFAETAADVLAETDGARMLLKVQKLLGHGSISSTEKYLRKRRGTKLRPGEAEGMREALSTGRIGTPTPVPLVALPAVSGGYSVDAGKSQRKGGSTGTAKPSRKSEIDRFKP